MRLLETEVTIIKKVILRYVSDARILLFGSRVYDEKRGGDIDIFVETKQNISFMQKVQMLAQMEIAGITRRVDLVIKTPTSSHQSIFTTIEKEGIPL